MHMSYLELPDHDFVAMHILAHIYVQDAYAALNSYASDGSNYEIKGWLPAQGPSGMVPNKAA